MAIPEQTPPEPAEKSNGSAVPGRPFQPGQSGNPGGRPKGLASKVRETIGADGEALTRFWEACMTGILETVVYEHTETRLGKNGRLYTRTVPEHTIRETVKIRDRIAVSKLLAERGWGKPPQFVPIEDDNPLEFGDREADQFAAEFDGRLGDIEAKRREREEREQ